MGSGIEIHGLVKSFRSQQGPVHAVRGINVSIEPGETVALLGPNGAGKSTTIDMTLGLARPDSGSVTVFGRPPREAVDAGVVGAMLQSGALIRDLSVRELITMVASLYPHPMDIEEVISLAGLTEAAGQRTQKLSGGQTQRVRFAVALVSDPDLLVLDEPTVSMDVEGRRDFWTAMREFASRGKTVVFATHYLEEADKNADRAVLMALGRIVADGPTTEIKAQVGIKTIRATLPGADCPDLAALPGVAAADRHGESVTLRCADSDLAIRALLARYPEARDIEITGAGLEEAFLELTSDPGNTEAGASSPFGLRDERGDLHALRTSARIPQPALLHLLARLPDRALLRDRRPATPRPRLLWPWDLRPALLHGQPRVIRDDDGDDLERRSHRRRAPSGLDAPAQDHTTPGQRLLPRQSTHLVHDGRAYTRAALYRGHLVRGHHASAKPDHDDGTDPRRAAPVRCTWNHARPPHDRRLHRTDHRGPGLPACHRERNRFPVTNGFLHELGQWLPSYWLVQAGRVALTSQGWGAKGWIVVIAWTLLLVALAGVAYRRDTGRV